MPSNTDEVIKATRQAEYALIGSLLIDATDGAIDVINYLKENLSPNDFYDDDIKRYYQAALSCALPPNQVNLAAELNRTGQLRKGDIQRLLYCLSVCPTYLDYDYYTIQVKEYARKRIPRTKGGVKL